MSWLSPLQMSQTHQTFSDRAEKGSGKWFLTDSAFANWKIGSGKRLWCWGIRRCSVFPGFLILINSFSWGWQNRHRVGCVGTLRKVSSDTSRSIAINHLRQSRPEGSKGRIGIMFIYLKYNEPEQTSDNILSSLLRQLVQELDEVPPAILSLYEHHRDRNTSPTSDEISQALATLIDDHEEVFCIIDALDECKEQLRWDLIEKLDNFGPKLRVLITSRYLESIAEELKTYERYELKANKADIELFIEHQIRKNRSLRKSVERSPSLRNDIKQGVVKTAENM